MSNRTPALVESAARHLVPTYRPRALVLDRGLGARVWDIEGRDYVDFSAGIAVSALGHGDPDLLAALHAQAQTLWHTSNVFLTEPPLRLAFNDAAAFDAVVDADVAAVIVEPVQGEGGVVPAAPGFLAHLRARCDEMGALLIFDEIQTGVGRSGKLWAHQWDGVAPDVMTLAKGLGCGFPIGAMLVAERAAQTLEFGSHGTTFGGNPLAAAVARVALRKLAAPALLANVETQSRALCEGLRALDEKHQEISQVRGRGLMLGAVLRPAFAGRAAEILDHAADAGLLMLQAGPDVLRFVPALNIGDADLADGLARLDAALNAWREARAEP